MAPNGSIETAIVAKIAESLQIGGSIANAVTRAVKAATDELFQDGHASQKSFQESISGTIEKFGYAGRQHPLMLKLQPEFPFLRVLLDATPAQLDQGWKLLQTDRNYHESMAEMMLDPSHALAFSVFAQNPGNAELAAMKEQLQYKAAPKQRWKALILPTHGGFPDKLRAFLNDKEGQRPTKSAKHSPAALGH